jgi:hypothetical protein
MSLNYGQSDGIISDRLLHHMNILLEVKYLNFGFFSYKCYGGEKIIVM